MIRHATGTGLTLLLAALVLTGCSSETTTTPILGPSAVFPPPPPASTLRVFADGTGFSTTDLRDAQEQIVQVTLGGELIWTSDDSRFMGFPAAGDLISAPSLCDCWLEVRFGTEGGERRAYLTAEYGHYNPGTIVDLEVTSGRLVMSHSSRYPPGTFTMSGTVSEMTPEGPVPLAGAHVNRLVGDGWRDSVTDDMGAYRIPGLYDGVGTVSVSKDGYLTASTTVTISGDTRFDIQLARR